MLFCSYILQIFNLFILKCHSICIYVHVLLETDPIFFLYSLAVATILNKMKRTHTTVGVDGSVYRYHPRFRDLMEKKIDELTDPNYKVCLHYFCMQNWENGVFENLKF